MKKTLLLILIISVGLPFAASAKDFHISFVEENYKETREQFSYNPLIYHSIQVNSSAGPKILVLDGSDLTYRKWFRRYLSEQNHFILKVDPSRTDQFISAKVFKTDITAIHPFDPPPVKAVRTKKTNMKTLKGNNYILLLDTHAVRTRLFKTVSKKMGYTTISFKNKSEAIKLFMLQPEKFKLITINNNVKNADGFVKEILSVKHNVPIMIDPGYRNQTANHTLVSKYAGFKSVHIKPVMLNDLQKTIRNLINENA